MNDKSLAIFLKPNKKGDNDIAKVIIKEFIEETQTDIFIAVAYFTDVDIADSIIKRTQNEYKTLMILNLADIIRPENNSEKFKVSKALFNIFQTFKNNWTDMGNLQIKTLGVNLSENSKYTTFHHKFIVSENNLIFGSLNLTNNAFNNNYENIVSTEDKTLIEQFYNHFIDLWNSKDATELLLKNGEIRKLSCPKCGHDDYIDFESWGLQCYGENCGYKFYNTAFK